MYEAQSWETEGFIHCSTSAQVCQPANALYRGERDLVLLEIDEERLPEPPRYEPGTHGEPMLFPHVYGTVPVDAVVAVHEFPPGPDGTFELPPALRR